MRSFKPSTPAVPVQLPLPGRQFPLFVLLFHVAFLAGMLLVLASRWRRPGFAWSGTEFLVGTLVLLQVGAYIRFFAWPGSEPVLRKRWAFYFPASFALWLVTWRLEPAFEWVVLGYLGQLLGAVPPKYSVPGAVTVFLVYLPARFGWSGLAKLELKDWLAYGALAIVWSALGLFIHRLAATSNERAKLIQELEAARKELELARDREAELAALHERERLARELHDSLGHGLVTLTVQLEAAQRLCGTDPLRACTIIEEMKVLTRQSMEQLRRSLAGLRAPGLGERPLREAISGLCAEVSSRTGLKLDYDLPEDCGRLSPPLAEAIWRIAQEGFANIEKHARATAAKVAVTFGSGESAAQGQSACSIQVRVSDDGVGLPPGAEAKAGHYGLRGLRERVEGLGGVFTACSEPDGGTTLQARLPVHLIQSAISACAGSGDPADKFL